MVSRIPIVEGLWLSAKIETIEERKAEVLIKLRKYKLLEKEKYEGAIGYIIDIPQDKEKALVWCILGEATVGIAAMNTLYKVMKEKDIDRTIVVTEGRYTHAVKLGAKKKKVFELTEEGKEFSEQLFKRFSELISVALEPSLEVCAHCGCKVYEGGHRETIKGKELMFCCCHCAASYKQSIGLQ